MNEENRRQWINLNNYKVVDAEYDDDFALFCSYMEGTAEQLRTYKKEASKRGLKLSLRERKTCLLGK